MDGIAALVRNLVRGLQPVPGWESCSPLSGKLSAPALAADALLLRGKKGFFCDNRDCRFCTLERQ